MSNTKTVYESAHGVFLDAGSCGSTVRYAVDVTANVKDGSTHMNMDVSLSDCTRVISWSGYGREGAKTMIKKLDAAIKELRAARTSLKFAITKLKDDE